MLVQLQRRAQTNSLGGHLPGPECLNDRGLLPQWFVIYRLREELYEARRYGYPLSVAILSPMMVGGEHDAEARIRAGTLAAREAARAQDLIGWLDGDDILVILPHTDRAGALAAIRRWSAKMSEATTGGDALKWLASALQDDGAFETADHFLAAALQNFRGID